jgi:hypothetical protein
MFSAEDPRPVVSWLCENYGLQEVLQAVAEFRPAAQTAEAPAKRAYKKRGSKKGGSKKGGSKKGGSKKGGSKKGARKQSDTGGEQG